MGSLTRIGSFALLLCAASIAAQTKPQFVVQPGRVAAVILPTTILTERDVSKQLASGLTTTFVLIARQRGAQRQGAARMEIRFDLWDQVWLVRRIEVDGKEDRQRIATRDALEKWWQSPVRFFISNSDRATLNIALNVLPFSASESEDARRWIESSGAGAAAEGGSPLVAALIGTTLSAEPIRSYRWTVDVSFR